MILREVQREVQALTLLATGNGYVIAPMRRHGQVGEDRVAVRFSGVFTRGAKEIGHLETLRNLGRLRFYDFLCGPPHQR